MIFKVFKSLVFAPGHIKENFHLDVKARPDDPVGRGNELTVSYLKRLRNWKDHFYIAKEEFICFERLIQFESPLNYSGKQEVHFLSHSTQVEGRFQNIRE